MSAVDFKDRVAIVTGAGGGLGRTHALALAARGVKVVVNDSAICTKAVWQHMRDNGYGRIVMTTSSSGMYGNFGQTNYGAAKAGLSGFMRTLCLEGAKYNIRINSLSPTAATRMTENLMPPEILAMLEPESVSQGLVYLCCDDAPNRTILVAGAGGYAATKVFETDGINLATADQTAENIAANWDKIVDEGNMQEFTQGGQQGEKLLKRAAALNS